MSVSTISWVNQVQIHDVFCEYNLNLCFHCFTGPGPCSLVRDRGEKFLAEAERLISLSNSSHIPVGYSFLLAENIKLSPVELQQAVSPGFRISDVLLSNRNSALQLAAYSSMKLLAWFPFYLYSFFWFHLSLYPLPSY